ncbi:MAG: hypothetical protein WBZ37_26050 [Mycobacterium sp.]
MTPKTAPTPVQASSPAQKAYEAATAAIAAAGAALAPAADKLAAAKLALETAQDEAPRAITEKSADPAAAKERFQKARKAVGGREDDVDWALFELQSFEVADEKAHVAEQVARGRVIAEEIVNAHNEFNDENSRENQLPRQVSDGIAQLIPIINDRKALQDRLGREWQHLPEDVRPQLKLPAGGQTTSSGPAVPRLVKLPEEVFDALRCAGIEISGR